MVPQKETQGWKVQGRGGGGGLLLGPKVTLVTIFTWGLGNMLNNKVEWYTLL